MVTNRFGVGVRSALGGLILLSLSACSGSIDGRSESQVAYDACASAHNEHRGSLNGGWAFVSGAGMVGSQCYWRWGADTPQIAVERALADCHQDYTNCYVFSTSAGLEPWAQKISNNGGDAGDNGPSLADWLNATAAGISTYNAYQGNTTTYSSGGTGVTNNTQMSTPQDTSSYNPQSCGRHYVGLMPKSACLAAGNLPDSSISSDEVPDPVANCWTPPC